METFKNLYKDIVTNKNNNIKELYQTGISILEKNNYENQIEILTKLIYFFPNDYLLYYYMGYIHLNINEYTALTWFKLCYEKNPDYLENILDMGKIFIDKDLELELFKYIKDEDVIKFNNDERFLLLIASGHLKNENFKKSLEYFLILIKKEDKMNDDLKIKIYNNIGRLYSNLRDLKTSSIYFKKTIDLLLKQKILNKKHIIEVVSNFITNQDYEYFKDLNLSYEEKFKNYELINDIYKEQNIYSFDLTNKLKNNSDYKIKIGFVSSDFFSHAVTNFILPILVNLRKNIFDIYLFYNNNIENSSPYINLLENINLIDISRVHDTLELSNFIYSYKIDILIDLNGHTSKNRLDIFALKPSPIQMTYLGFPNTTGLKTIDYRITDKIADHPESKQIYSEKLIYMSKCFLCYFNILQNKKEDNKEFYNNIILGSLNKELKISLDVLHCWKKILEKTPNNVKLLIKLESEKDSLYLEEKKNYYLKELNCDSERIIFIPRTSQPDYFKLFSFIDMLLDTFPYSGTTTTCNALFNSVPVITLYNQNSHVQSVSSSLLINSGFPELVTYSEDEYVQKVVDLTQDIEKIKMYKKNIHLKFKELMNPKLFVKEYEEILINLYNKHFIN